MFKTPEKAPTYMGTMFGSQYEANILVHSPVALCGNLVWLFLYVYQNATHMRGGVPVTSAIKEALLQ